VLGTESEGPHDGTGRCTDGVALATLVLVLVGASGNALAANFTVDTTADAVDTGGCVTTGVQCTLRDAVIAANAASGSSTIGVPAGTYDLTIAPSGSDDATTGDLNVTADVTINGALNTSTVVDGGGTSTGVTNRVFRVESTGRLTLTNMTIQHGHPAGGNLTLSEGGGILALGPLSLSDVNVSNNFVETPGDTRNGAGGGISQGASVPISLTRVAVISNTVKAASGAVGGGGGLMLAGGGGGDVTITDSDISSNTSAGPGGGIYSNPAANAPSLTITGTTITGNHAALPLGLSSANHAWGGGLGTDGSIPVSLTGDTISDNTADQTGGGIFDNGASAYTITNTTIFANAAVAGIDSGGVIVGGGGIFADGGNVSPGWTLNGDLIADNTAGDGTHPNVAGGGIEENGGDLFTIVNTTISDNAASGEGGGYQSDGGGTHQLTNVTLNLNIAGAGGGDIDNSGGATFTLANTIVAHGAPANCGSALSTSLGHNLESANTCGLGATGDLTNTDPKLARLNVNGGPHIHRSIATGQPGRGRRRQRALPEHRSTRRVPIRERGVRHRSLRVPAFDHGHEPERQWPWIAPGRDHLVRIRQHDRLHSVARRPGHHLDRRRPDHPPQPDHFRTRGEQPGDQRQQH
jgi:CSLREA domain-containing protein